MPAREPDVPPFFSPDYFAARERFCAEALEAGAQPARYQISALGPGRETLGIDTAYLGPPQPRRVLIVNSGVHGVEGFLGSALQCGLLARLRAVPSGPDIGVLLVHALNPYGFAHLRRTNEHNVDLNRNALASFPGPANPEYAALDAWLNPRGPTGAVDGFWRGALRHLLARGIDGVKQAIAGGQYQFPRGVFYGGAKREQSIAILEHVLRQPRFAGSQAVFFLDIHTGLGRRGGHRILVDATPDTDAFARMHRWFGDAVQSNNPDASVAYRVTGGLLDLVTRVYQGRRVDAAVLEFGTYPAARVIRVLRFDNQAHQYDPPGSDARRRAQSEMRETFFPADPRWRARVYRDGEAVLARALEALAR